MNRIHTRTALLFIMALAACAATPAEVAPPPGHVAGRIIPVIYEIKEVPKDYRSMGVAAPIEGTDYEQIAGGSIGAVLVWEPASDDTGVEPVKYEIHFGDTPENIDDHNLDWTTGWKDWTEVGLLGFDTNATDGIDFHRIAKKTYQGFFFNKEITLNIRGRITFANGTVIESQPADEPRRKMLSRDKVYPDIEFPDWYITRGVDTALWVRRDGGWKDVCGPGGIREGLAPLTVGIQVDGIASLNDGGDALYYAIDWGDGAGWKDVTEETVHYDSNAQDGIRLDGVSAHTYTEPGTYYIDAKAKYWDEEVHYMAPGWGQTVIVH